MPGGKDGPKHIDLAKLREDLGIENPREGPQFKAEPHPDRVEKYNVFKKAVDFDTGVIYHPCGGCDVSPSETFKGSKVIYADIEDRAMQALRDAGYEAHTVDALGFDPGPVDVLVLMNPSIDPTTPASHVKPNGYVLCNDYHDTASELRRNPKFELIALVHPAEKGLVFDADNFEDYWKTVETNEEFQKAAPEIYAHTSRLIKELGGNTDNLIREYQRIKDELKNGTLEGVSGVISDEDGTTFNYKDRICFLFALPSKVGHVDDVFVFQKNLKQAKED